jgi:hypothetical protein
MPSNGRPLEEEEYSVMPESRNQSDSNCQTNRTEEND